MNKTISACRRPHPRLGVLALMLAAAPHVHAAELANNDSYVVRWDNTVKYTVGARTLEPKSFYTGDLNTNDGDAAFGRGDLVTNRIDWLSEIGLTLKDAQNSGVRVSVAGWYDHVYRSKHKRIDPLTYNATSADNNEFTNYARKWAGANIELLDAFVHSGVDLGGHNLSFRLGRHTLIWGESLLLAANGIAAGQGPIDITKALTVPGIRAQEVFMPINQLSGAFGLSDNWDLAAYYQFEFRPHRLPPPGTFFSPADVVIGGAESLLLAPGFGVPRTGSDKPSDGDGQWGVSAKYRNPDIDWDFGLYYLRYHDMSPMVHLQFGGIPVFPFVMPTNYFFVYPRNIEVYGVSTSTHLGDANVAGEISIRNNVPLLTDAMSLAVFPGMSVDGDGDELFARGRSLHYQASTIWVVPRTGLWDTADFVAEIGGNRLLKTTKNKAARAADTSRSWLGTSMTFEPKWYQVFPSVDLSLPINLTYNFNDKAPAVAGIGGARGGSASIGLNFIYANQVRGGISYTNQFGDYDKNPFGDRDFVSLNVSYSF